MEDEGLSPVLIFAMVIILAVIIVAFVVGPLTAKLVALIRSPG